MKKLLMSLFIIGSVLTPIHARTKNHEKFLAHFKIATGIAGIPLSLYLGSLNFSGALVLQTQDKKSKSWKNYSRYNALAMSHLFILSALAIQSGVHDLQK